MTPAGPIFKGLCFFSSQNNYLRLNRSTRHAQTWMSRWGCGFPGSWQLQARPSHASNRSLYQSKINQYQDWAPTQADSSPPGTMQGLATVPKKYQSPSQVTQSQKKPGAGWEVALEEVTIPQKMYIGDLNICSPCVQTPNLPLSVGWPCWSPDPMNPIFTILPCKLKNPL